MVLALGVCMDPVFHKRRGNENENMRTFLNASPGGKLVLTVATLRVLPMVIISCLPMLEAYRDSEMLEL